ncbi:hypothetical protein GCM10027341_49650 [Spirosoma knui]
MLHRELLFNELQSLQYNPELEYEVKKPVVGRIAWAKSVLNTWSGAALPDDNQLTDDFKRLLIQFQSAAKLNQTGTIDFKTERALLEQNAERSSGAAGGTSSQIISTAKSRLEDWTDKAVIPATKKKLILTTFRDPRTITSLVLHHMAYKAKDSKGTYSNPQKYLAVGAHFCIMLDGRIMQHHPISRFIWHSNCTSPRSVGVEFEGNFPDIKGRWWYPTDKKTKKKIRINEDQPTQAQFDSGRFLVQYLKTVLNLKHVLAHRQSSEDRENDPGPAIWFNVGEWSLKNLGLSDGGPGFKCGTGNSLLPEWRKQTANTPAITLSGPSGTSAQKESKRVLQNRTYANTLGWGTYLNQINDFLLPYSGLSNVSLGEKAFAEALAVWQRSKGLQDDGILGPNTWTLLKKALGLSATTSGGAVANAMPDRFRMLIPALTKYRGNWPLDFLLAWIKKESDGSIKSHTSLDERGYFQLHPDESKTLNVDHQRLSTDSDYSIQAGIQLVNLRAKSAAKYAAMLGVPASGEVYLALTKLMHWLPFGVQNIVSVMKKKGFAPKSWESFKAFCVTNSAEIQAGINQKGRWPLANGLKNTDDVFKYAKEFRQLL